MAKANNRENVKQQKDKKKQVEKPKNVVQKTLKELAYFPGVKVKFDQDLHGNPYISDVSISKELTFISKRMSAGGKILAYSFKKGAKTYTFD